MTPTTDRPRVRHDTLSGVTSRGTDRKSIRVDSDLWDEFGEATAERKDGRSGVLREYMRWFLRKPDAALPEPDALEEGPRGVTGEREVT